MHEQVGDFLEFAFRGEVEDVVAAVVEVVAAAADGAEGGVAGGDAGKRDGFFGLEGRRDHSWIMLFVLGEQGVEFFLVGVVVRARRRVPARVCI